MAGKGMLNSQFGTIWVTNTGGSNRKDRKDHDPTTLQESGWAAGRTMPRVFDFKVYDLATMLQTKGVKDIAAEIGCSKTLVLRELKRRKISAKEIRKGDERTPKQQKLKFDWTTADIGPLLRSETTVMQFSKMHGVSDVTIYKEIRRHRLADCCEIT
jgi:IS30 family transposase